MPEPVGPGGVIGILGGGQLGRMLALAAARLGLKCHIYAPPGDNPAFDVAHARTEAGYGDDAALLRFAGAVDVVTYEFENVPLAAAARLARIRPLYPPARALEVSQDRVNEKSFFRDLGIATAPWTHADDPEALARAAAAVGFPGILKTRRLGYDGKGQARIADAEGLRQGIAALGGAGLVYEGFVPFSAEVSVIAARGRDGATAVYDIGENVHRDGILRTTTVPAAIRPETAGAARAIALRTLDALDYVGVIGIELFVVREGEAEHLIVNEFAPRVHNSGHWTLDGCLVSQFEQHVRAVAGWPLADPARHADACMHNLIGAEADDWRSLATRPGAALHLYGKSESRPGRKMGHLTELKRR